MASHDERLCKLEEKVNAIFNKMDAVKEKKIIDDQEQIIWKTKVDMVVNSLVKIWVAIVLAVLTGITGIVLHFIEESLSK